ncbi:hypothetical protein QET93_001850 [Akkermansia sp. N21116]|uniref:hypothetical protein n=1 Tax=Akkermansia sp. N21116 TaxID=3040764 RepID=UPI00244E7171|nr:hypothetical protein [Akkermansia sp. N21116]WPX40845.1 hypothetical protein QET93_001850 [Akkermansia sp. N21116]
MNDYIIGTPDLQADAWQFQTQPDSCAVVAEMSLINQFGYGLDQDQACYISFSNGWYQPGAGTSLSDIGNMMDMYHIPNHSVQNATLGDLARELQAGHGIIVGIDSDQLWDQGPLNDLKIALCKGLGLDSSQFMPADHAVVVTGIDASDPNNPMVILNDSGSPDGQAIHYPLDKFMDAWENSDLVTRPRIFRCRMGVSWDPFRVSTSPPGSVRGPALAPLLQRVIPPLP